MVSTPSAGPCIGTPRPAVGGLTPGTAGGSRLTDVQFGGLSDRRSDDAGCDEEGCRGGQQYGTHLEPDHRRAAARERGEGSEGQEQAGRDAIDPPDEVPITFCDGDDDDERSDSSHRHCLGKPLLQQHTTVVHGDRLKPGEDLSGGYRMRNAPESDRRRGDVGECVHAPNVTSAESECQRHRSPGNLNLKGTDQSRGQASAGDVVDMLYRSTGGPDVLDFLHADKVLQAHGADRSGGRPGGQGKPDVR